MRLEKLQDVRNFPAWLCRIAQNLAVDWLRKGSREPKLASMVSLEGVGMELEDAKAVDAPRKIDEEKRNEALQKAIFDLPAEQREVVLLHYTEGLKQTEIAARLGLHPVAVGRCLKRALATLKKNLEPMVQDSASGLRPMRRAVVRTIAFVGAMSILEAPSKSALAAMEGKVAETALMALSASKSSGSLLSSLGFLKTIFTAMWTGGKIMGTGKAIGVIAAAAVLGGGVFYYNNSNAKQQGARSHPETERTNRSAGPLNIPPDVYARVLALQREGLLLLDPSGNLFNATEVAVVHTPDRVEKGVLIALKNSSDTVAGEISLGNAGAAPLGFSDETGKSLPFRVVDTGDPRGRYAQYVTLSDAWGKGNTKTFFVEYPFSPPSSDRQSMEGIRPDGKGNYALTFSNGMGDGIQQFIVALPDDLVLTDSSEKPAVQEKVGSFAIQVWRRRMHPHEQYTIRMTLRPTGEEK